jgi:hypothetical protein
VKSLSTENVVVKKSPFLIIISTFKGRDRIRIRDPDPVKNFRTRILQKGPDPTGSGSPTLKKYR